MQVFLVVLVIVANNFEVILFAIAAVAACNSSSNNKNNTNNSSNALHKYLCSCCCHCCCSYWSIHIYCVYAPLSACRINLPYGLSPRNSVVEHQHRRLSFESASDDRWPPKERGRTKKWVTNQLKFQFSIFEIFKQFPIQLTQKFLSLLTLPVLKYAQKPNNNPKKMENNVEKLRLTLQRDS